MPLATTMPLCPRCLSLVSAHGDHDEGITFVCSSIECEYEYYQRGY